MSAGSVVLLVILAAICAEFHLTSAFQFIDDQERTLIQIYPKTKALKLIWKWRLSVSESVIQAQIKRYQTTKQVETEKSIAFVTNVGEPSADKKYFQLSGKVGPKSGGGVGEMELTIMDINNQGYNKGSDEDINNIVNVMVSNYTYVCAVTVQLSQSVDNRLSKVRKLIVHVIPTITGNKPENKYVDNTKRDVVLTCKADGKPKPNIVWEIRASGTITTKKEDELTISKLPGDPFNKNSDVGIYTCTATNDVGKANASAVVQYTECNAGCSADDKIAIKMKDLAFNSDYDNPNSDKYKELKDAIERECMEQYHKAEKQSVYSCVVTKFREGSVVANIKITYPSKTEKPREPLEKAIKTGTFARQRVETDFVSPTSPPTQATQPTDKSTDKPSDSPDSGKRANDDTSGSLSKVAIISMVVVFSIIFIVIIVVLIVCMLKRRKPAGSHIKPYQEDGKGRTAASAPLKSQPYKDPLYDNEPDKPKDVVYADLNFQDRHTNGGGPPPQYTPSSNYAEVRPSQAEQNESGVEWDKSVRDEMWI